jgi:hypothetical protein
MNILRRAARGQFTCHIRSMGALAVDPSFECFTVPKGPCSSAVCCGVQGAVSGADGEGVGKIQ